MRLFITACLAAIFLSGCALPPQQPSIDVSTLPESTFGPQPSVESVKSFLRNELKDPESAQFKIGSFEKCYLREAPISGGKISRYGWCIRVAVNAKNSYGGYVGFKENRIFVSAMGEIIRFEANQFKQESWYRD